MDLLTTDYTDFIWACGILPFLVILSVAKDDKEGMTKRKINQLISCFLVISEELYV